MSFMVLLLAAVRTALVEVDPLRPGDVEPLSEGADSRVQGGGGIGLRLASGVERGDLREDGLKASGGVLGHRALEGEDATGEGQRLGVGVVGVGHGGWEISGGA